MPAATNPSRSTPVGASAVSGGVSSVDGGGGGGAGVSSPSSPPSAVSVSGVASPSGGSVDPSGLRCPIGAMVRCVLHLPANSITYEGEVLAYDPRKVLVIKSSSSSGRNSLNNVHMVNLCQPCDIQILSEKREPLPDLPSLNVARLNNRMRDQVERKRKQVMAFKVGVSPVGHKLFQAISKTIDDVVWNGENISVLKEVTIYPPYRPEDVKGNTDSKALKHVRKIVEKHIADQQQQHHNSSAVSPHRTSAADSAGGGGGGPAQSPSAAAVVAAASAVSPAATQDSSKSTASQPSPPASSGGHQRHPPPAAAARGGGGGHHHHHHHSSSHHQVPHSHNRTNNRINSSGGGHHHDGMYHGGSHHKPYNQ